MSRPDDDLVEGRARRSHAFTVVAVMVALVAALPLAYARLSGDGGGDPVPSAAVPSPLPTGEADQPGPAGRLVFTTFETRGSPDLQQQLWVLDLRTGVLSEGPMVPTVEELWVADPDRGWLVMVTGDRRAGGIAYLLTGLSPATEPIELARGELLSLSTDGAALLAGRSEPTGRTGPVCEGHRYVLSRVDVGSGAKVTLDEGRLACGTLVSGTLVGETPIVSFVRRGRPEVRRLDPGDATFLLLPGVAHVSGSPTGRLLLVQPERGVLKGLGVWPRTPTGPALIWPSVGAPRPLVTGERVYVQRVVAWSPDGGRVVVGGIVDDERSLWLVYVPAGTMVPLLPPNSFPLRSAFSGAAFDDAGNAYGGAPGTLVVASEAAIAPIPLPPDAPSPAGPVAWLP